MNLLKSLYLNFSRERKIKKTLRRLAYQRVALVLQPGNVWVIEKAVQDNEETSLVLKTCDMRGWIELMENSIPQERLSPGGKLPVEFSKTGPLYRVTEAGWAVINRTHRWSMVAIFLALVAIILQFQN